MRTLALLALVLLAPLALAHNGLDDEEPLLGEGGEALMMGEVGTAQPGALVVVPVEDAPIPCTFQGRAMPLGNSTVSLRANRTHLAASFDVPQDAYVAIALDEGAGVRTLMLMKEYVMAFHAIGAAVVTDGRAQMRAGLLGVPHEVESLGAHDMDMGPLEGRGIRMDYDQPQHGTGFCQDAPGHVTIYFHRDGAAPTPPGRVVHALLLHDDVVPRLLPRPLDDSTTLVELNLYLPREGEQVESVRAALDPSPDAAEVVPLLFVPLGLVWALWRERP